MSGYDRSKELLNKLRVDYGLSDKNAKELIIAWQLGAIHDSIKRVMNILYGLPIGQYWHEDVENYLTPLNYKLTKKAAK